MIPGWRRSDQEVARFKFGSNGESYSAKVGKGTRNTGVIAVAVFDEKVELVTIQQPLIIERPVVIREVYPWARPWSPYPDLGPYITCDTALIGSSGHVVGSTTAAAHTGGAPQATLCAASMPNAFSGQPVSQVDLGTGYGQRAAMQNRSVKFQRAGSDPTLTLVLRYGTRERLATLGVPVDRATAPTPSPNPFPGSSCPEPLGWSG